MAGIDAMDFASLLCSRLCHDLLSPVGALNNGIELLADENDPEMQKQVISLLADSARASANKLKFFRLAFGAAGGFDSEIDTREARTAIEGLFSANSRLEINWLVNEPTLPKSVIKTLLNLAMIAGDALVRGGRLDIGAERRGAQIEIVLRAEGDRIILDPELRTTLSGKFDSANLSSRTAAAYLVAELARSMAGEIQVSPADQEFLLIGSILTIQ